MDILELKNVEKTFHLQSFWGKSKEVHAVNGVSFSLQKGETLGLVGESGCGKSTLANLIIRLEEPTGGDILFDGKNITHEKEKNLKWLRKKIQIVFQDPYSSLSPRMTVKEILMEPARILGGMTNEEMDKRATMLMEYVGLRKNSLEKYPHEFSGGQRQRISIARALMTKPDLLLLDEPTSALDVSVQAQVLDILITLKKELELSYLFISHNLAVIKYIADRTAVMEKGKLVEIGTSQAIFEHPSRVYTKELIDAVPMIGKPFQVPRQINILQG